MELTKYQRRAAAWVLIAVAAGLIVWLLAPVLMPFVVAWVLAYVLNPLVDRLDELSKARLPRWLSVAVIEVVVMLALIGVLMLVLPLFIKQLPELGRQLPVLFEKARVWIESRAARYGVRISLDLSTLSAWAAEYFEVESASTTSPKKNMAHSLLSSLVMGGNVALSILGHLTLIPLALYYLLLDWKHFNQTLYNLVPHRLREAVVGFLREADEVLGQYLRGQLLVMGIMALFYSIGLMLFGLDLAWPIGIFTGLALFIPYIGFAVGMVMAALVGVMQLGLTKTAIMVAVVFGIGQFLESFFLTPRLVGERIGLHPLMVIFALLAFGQLFGFVGVLIALPTSAVLLVAIRRLRQQYVESNFYKDKG